MRLFGVYMGIFCMLVFFTFPQVGQAVEDVSARQAVLMEQETGNVLFDKKAHEQRSVASITKVMTAIIALEYGKLDDKVKVSERAIYTEGSAIYLANDETMSLEDLLYGLMLRSGNDAAVAIAEHIGGSVEGFTFLMNEKAKWIGMQDSSFANPHGLEAEDHYSTAYDIALLMRYAMENTAFKKISNTENYQSENRTYTWHNKNKLLTRLYPYSTGGKTGFTKKAGRTLVTTASKEGLDLIVVTLNAGDDWNDHIQLFEWGFDAYEWLPETQEFISNDFIGDAERKEAGVSKNTSEAADQIKSTEISFLEHFFSAFKLISQVKHNG